MTYLVEEEIFPTIQVAEDSVKEEVNGTDLVGETKHDTKRKFPEKQAGKKVLIFVFSGFSLCFLCGKIPHFFISI